VSRFCIRDLHTLTPEADKTRIKISHQQSKSGHAHLLVARLAESTATDSKAGYVERFRSLLLGGSGSRSSTLALNAQLERLPHRQWIDSPEDSLR
jgi:hypothetical protein